MHLKDFWTITVANNCGIRCWRDCSSVCRGFPHTTRRIPVVVLLVMALKMLYSTIFTPYSVWNACSILFMKRVHLRK
jgi:hypothetical protein